MTPFQKDVHLALVGFFFMLYGQWKHIDACWLSGVMLVCTALILMQMDNTRGKPS